MRILVATLALLAAPLVSAQSSPPPGPVPDPDADTGVFTELGVAGGYGGGGVGAIGVGTVSLGYRLPSGLSVGAHASGVQYGGLYSGLAFGPEVRYQRSLGESSTLDVHASGTIGFYGTDRLSGSGFQRSGFSLQTGATSTRRFDLGRGVRLATTGGLLGGVTRSDGLDFDSGFSTEDRTGAYAGVVVGAQFEFEALGARFAVGPSVYIPVVSSNQPPLGLHQTGGGPRRGFLTVTF